jgi:hypothetical protein
MEEKKGRERKGIPAEDIEEAVDDILIRRARGEELDKRDRLVLAYCYHRPRCHHKHR